MATRWAQRCVARRVWILILLAFAAAPLPSWGQDQRMDQARVGACGVTDQGQFRPWSNRGHLIRVAGPAIFSRDSSPEMIVLATASESAVPPEMPRALALDNSASLSREPAEALDTKERFGIERMAESSPTGLPTVASATILEVTPSGSKSLRETIAVQMLSTLAALTVFSGILVLAHFLLIRRFGSSSLPLFRVEVVSRAPDVPEGQPPSNYPGFRSASAGHPLASNPDACAEPFAQKEAECAVPSLEAGPTTVQTWGKDTETKTQREIALLRQLMELNSRLLNELEQMHAVRASAFDSNTAQARGT
jgi:hypothetical protein